MTAQGAFSFFLEPAPLPVPRVDPAAGCTVPVPTGALPGRVAVRCYQCNAERVPHGRLLVGTLAVDLCARCTVEEVQRRTAAGAYVPPGYEWVAAWSAS
jgi:hypothetical protein